MSTSEKKNYEIFKAVRATKDLRSMKGGNYASATPAGAARKAFRQCLQALNVKGALTLTLHMRQKGTDKVLGYKVTKVKDPRTYVRGGVEITSEYTTKVKSLGRMD
jgi:hypothetical protein